MQSQHRALYRLLSGISVYIPIQTWFNIRKILRGLPRTINIAYNCPALVQGTAISSIHFSTALHKNISFIRHSFHGNTQVQQINLLSTVWHWLHIYSSVGKSAVQEFAKVMGSNLVEVTWIFQVNVLNNCLNCPASARIKHFFYSF